MLISSHILNSSFQDDHADLNNGNNLEYWTRVTFVLGTLCAVRLAINDRDEDRRILDEHKCVGMLGGMRGTWLLMLNIFGASMLGLYLFDGKFFERLF